MSHWIKDMNMLGMRRIPFFFMLDFELKSPFVCPFIDLPDNFHINTGLLKYNNEIRFKVIPLQFNSIPMPFEEYQQGFNKVMQHIQYGNSFLTNYTGKTSIETNYSLKEIYAVAEAKYKLLVDDQFVSFSPETFVTIKAGNIFSFPMKGTIDANIPNAETLILADPKETSEHYTIVDLIRNDLSRVAKKVHVPNFRYIDKITSNHKDLLQVSSMVQGALPADYREHLGTIFSRLLPAGSISGAPKKKTCQIIKEAEGTDRGMYTGIFGIFDGSELDSAVAIRYIENDKGQLYYRSGGGITFQSKVEIEYQEMLDKVYVPINRKYKDLQWSGLQHPTT